MGNKSHPSLVQVPRLQESHHRDRVLDTAHEGIWTIDLDGRTTFVNDRMAELLGYSPGEMVGRVHIDFMWEEDRPRGAEQFEQRRLGIRGAFDQRYQRKDGTELWTIACCNNLFDAEGRAVGARGLFIDITERKWKEHEFNRENEQLRVVYEHAPAAIAVLDTQLRYLRVNPRWLAVYGLLGQEVLGRSHHELFPETPPRWNEIHRRCLAGAVEQCDEELVVRADGRRQWVRWSIHPWHEKSGAVGGITMLTEDVTAKKESEEALRQLYDRTQAEKSQLSLVVDNIIEEVWFHDPDGRVILENAAAQQAFGPVKRLESGKLAASVEVYHPDGTPRAADESPISRALAGEEIRDLEEIVRLPVSGELRTRCVTSVPAHGPDGAIVGVVSVVRDITEAKRIEAELRAKTVELESMLASAPVGIGLYDRALRYLRVNQALAEINGVPAPDHVGRTLADIVPDIAASITEVLAEVFATGEAINGFEVSGQTRRQPGVERHWICGIYPIHSQPGVVSAAGVWVVEITERKRIEDALRASEELFRAVFDQAAVGIAVAEPKLDGVFLQANQTLEDMLGYGRGELLGVSFQALTHPDDRAANSERLRAILAGEVSTYSMEKRYLHRDGHGVWVKIMIALVRTPAGAPSFLIGSLADISELKQAEQTLRANEQRMRLATEATRVGIWEWNVITNQIRWDAEMFRIYGTPPTPDGHVDYAYWRRAVLPEDLPENEALLQDNIRRRGQSTRNFRIRRRNDGECRHIESVETVRTNDTGQVEYVVGTNLDITERRRIETELRDADRRKDEFLATLAHELRNPLAPVRNALRILDRKSPDVPEVQRATEVIDRQVQALGRLIDDLMDVSRVNQGKVSLKREHVELAKVLQGAIETSHPLIDEMGHDLVVTVPPGLVIVDADPTRLAQVLMNLLNNAAKYTERGGRIELRVELTGGELMISVADTGIGIPGDKLGTIFDMFSQVDGALSRSQGGLGIGLSLVKRLVEKHGGTIEARSGGIGQGSEFVARLPIVVSAGNSRESNEHRGRLQSTSNLRVLVVDDNRDAAETTAMLLEMMGNTVQSAHDGAEAVAAAETFRPDVVLCDIGLPKLNGYDVARALRQRPWGRQMYLVALTGWGQDADKRQALEAGFDHHLTKPVDPEQIEALLTEFHPRGSA